MPPEQLDADMAAHLTPEELEAINDGDDQPSAEDAAALQRIADGAPNDDDEPDDDDAGNPNAAPIEGKPNTQPAEGNTDEAPAANTEATTNDEPVAQASTRYDAQLPADYDEKIKGLKDRDAELRQQFKDGEIDIDERDAGLAEISEQREQLVVLRAKAEISQEMNQQTAQQQWQNTINRSMADFAKPEHGGIDYRKDADKAADLDQFVKVLAAKTENSDKPMDWFLTEAHKRVMALHGVTKAQPKPVDPVADAIAKRKPPTASAPTTLAQVPGSDGPGDVEGEFADIEALEGMEYEDAIARMSPTQRDKFLRGR